MGYYLLKALLSEGHEVLAIEKDARVCKTITDELGGVCFRGDGCEAATLAEVGTGRADMFVPATMRTIWLPARLPSISITCLAQ